MKTRGESRISRPAWTLQQLQVSQYEGRSTATDSTFRFFSARETLTITLTRSHSTMLSLTYSLFTIKALVASVRTITKGRWVNPSVSNDHKVGRIGRKCEFKWLKRSKEPAVFSVLSRNTRRIGWRLVLGHFFQRNMPSLHLLEPSHNSNLSFCLL